MTSLARVVGLQAAGSIATLTSVMMLARGRGAEIQGAFGIVKAEVDLLVAMFLLGMPQSVFYHLSRGRMSGAEVRRITAVQSVIAGALAVVVLAYRHPDAWHGVAVGLVAAAGAVAALVAHGNMRGAILHTHSAIVFSGVTALPGLFLLLGVAVALGLGAIRTTDFGSMGLLLGGASVAACAVTAVVLRQKSISTAVDGGATGSIPLFGYGIATWIPAVGQSLSPVVALGWIRGPMDDAAGVGVFSAAILATNVVLAPVAMLIPLLFKRWVGVEADARWLEMGRAMTWLLPVSLGFAGIVLLLEDPVVGTLFGPEYVSRGSVFAVMALGIGPQMVTRLLGVAFNAAGRPWLGVVGESARVAALAAGLALFDAQSLMTVAVSWVCAECVAAILGWLIARFAVRSKAVA